MCILKSKKNGIVLLLLLVLLITFACAKKNELSDTGVQTETQEETKKELASVDLSEGMEMPNVVVETNKGNTFDLSKTDKPVLINFWATWCPPCRAEMPGLQNLYEEYSSKIDFVMIDLGETKETIQDFLIENEVYTFPIGYDEKDEYGFKFNIMSIPTTLIIGKDKKIKNLVIGMRTEDQYKELIEEVIK